MKGSECRLIEYMEGSKKRFIIPVYQRNYDWKMDNCKQLYNDLVKIIKNNRKSHFFGSIVSVYEPSGRNTEFLVIDGQQRLTTISLLFLAMYNLINDGVLTPNDPSLGKQIYEDFLVDKYQPEEKRIKLKPIKNDQKAFGKLFEGEKEHIKESNLTYNYMYFYERIQKQEITLEELFDAICSLEIINITLSNEDNPQLIFESLNSTGLDLSEGDKIRNFILMGLPSKQQEEFYEKYWNKIEECTKYDASSFIRDYLSVKIQRTPSQSRVYTEFKDFVETSKKDIEELLIEMLEYARRYAVLLGAKTENKQLNACINRLNRWEATVTRPFFLEVLRLNDNDELTMDDVVSVFLMVENYLFRRNICDLPTNSLNKIFLALHKDVVRYDSTVDNYVEKLKYALLSKKEKARFPEDREFVEAFSQKLVYKMNAKNKIYIFERFENYGTAEDKDVYSHCDDGTYSIEHIMPQHLSPVWEKELGEDYTMIHDTWLHRMANLTLTAYNSSYSNHSFTEKKTMKNGFDDSGIRMNTWICKKDKWTLAELEERNQYLMERALEIWASPVTSFKPAEKQLDTVSLDDDIDELTGRSIAKFSFKGTEYPVTSWVDMYTQTLQMVYAEDKSILMKLAISTEEGAASHFSLDKTVFIKSTEIGDGIYVFTHSNTQSKLNVLLKVFGLYNIDPSDLVFSLRDELDIDEKEIGTRHELRRKYWAYALEFIHKAHETEGSFNNVNPSKENWISGFFGVQGFSICCIGNFDSVRVELYLGKADKEKNKEAFDKLLVHKAEIEQTLGVELTWDRNDDVKASKILYELQGIGIEHEDDWEQAAKFHAEWSKKFYDTFVPHLK